MLLERSTDIYIRGNNDRNILGENVVSYVDFYIGLEFGCGAQYVLHDFV